MQLFDLLSVFYALLGIRAIWTAIRNWRTFTDDQLTAIDRRLASELAFFVFIPIGVFLHELGHALATIQVGGQVGGFHYALFYGYVIPVGQFTPLEEWWIALSGNLVSIAYGFLPLIFILVARKAWIRYILLASARIQLAWSLVGYPLLTLAGFEGDWQTIYRTSYLLSVPLFITQAALVMGLWRLDRSSFVKRWETRLYSGAGDQLRLLDSAINLRPGAVDPILARGNFFAAQAQPELAVADYRAALKLDPQNPRALYNIGQLQLIRRNFAAAEKNFRAALTRAGADPEVAGRVHYGLATCLYHLGKASEAIQEFTDAITRLPDVAEFYFWRGTAYRSMRDDTNARNDFARTAELASVSNPELASRAREMLSHG
jgi:tetratricopeptide (TPR) repeat protein